MLSDGVIELVEIDPAQTQALADGSSPLPAVPDYPSGDSVGLARLWRDAITIDNWVPGFGLHLVRRCTDGLVIGDVGFHTPPDERGVVEIGYGLAPSARGMGFASRAVRLLVTAAIARGNVSCVVADTTVDNVPSIRLLESVGFLRVREQSGRVRYRLVGPPHPRRTTRAPARSVDAADLVVIVVFVPEESAAAVRDALAAAGAGSVGAYSACSFTSAGKGRFVPGDGAAPYLGQPGRQEIVPELRIECVCSRARARQAITAMLAVHPYEEPAWHCHDTIALADLP